MDGIGWESGTEAPVRPPLTLACCYRVRTDLDWVSRWWGL
jgi:hypothetical protein